MDKQISKKRRIIESFLLIGFFILFITLAVGQAGSKVGTDARSPLQAGEKLSSIKSIDKYEQCCCNKITIHNGTILGNWVNNEPQLPLNRLKTDPGVTNSVMDVEIEISYKNKYTHYLTLRFSNKGKIFVLSSSVGNCGGSAAPFCCFDYQTVCCTMSWLFPWMEFYCPQTFWQCWFCGDCFRNHLYSHWLHWILCTYFWCCD